MHRITVNDLRSVVNRINRVTRSPEEPYTKDDATGRLRANIGNYHLSQAYGGYSLHRMVSGGGAVSEPLSTGHIPARDLYERMHSFLRGWEARGE